MNIFVSCSSSDKISDEYKVVTRFLMKNISKFLMVAALAAIGMNTDFNEMKKSGLNPMIHGFIISALVVIVAIGVEYAMGIV